MIYKIISLLLLASLSFTYSGCKKEEQEYSVEPNISFLSISPGSIQAYTDSLVIQIEYTDGDGDLGENASGVENAFITDLRSNLVYVLRIRQLGPDNANIIIKGKINLVIPAVGLSQGGTSAENASFEVYIVDRAGHQSNRITSNAITVNP